MNIDLEKDIVQSLSSLYPLQEFEEKAIQTILDALPSAELGTNLAEVGTDCISRRSAIDALRGYLVGKRCPDDGTLTCRLIENEVINKLPSAEPKRGRWIEDKGQQTLMQNFIERGEVWRVCSVCGAGHMIGYKYAIDKAYHDRHHNFCPNCGADMRQREE